MGWLDRQRGGLDVATARSAGNRDRVPSVYVLSAEWPAEGPGAGPAAAFFGSIKLRTDCEDARAVEARERWREFTATVEHTTDINHGYFYSGFEGTVQLRGWARDQDYRAAQGDIGELLDGLTIRGLGGTLVGAR